jgi:hypothetical protein
VMRNWGERGITAKQLNVKKGDIIKVKKVFVLILKQVFSLFRLFLFGF